MGQKLDIGYDDDLFDSIRKEQPTGISGGCYCCGQQIHLQFDELYVLPLAKINSNLFQVLMCDICERDITTLEKSGIENVSYDILFFIQKNLKDKLYEINKKNGSLTIDDRIDVLLSLYESFKNKEKIRKQSD